MKKKSQQPQEHYSIPIKPENANKADKKLKDRLTESCNQLNMVFDVDFSFEIDDKSHQIIINECRVDKNEEPQVHQKAFPYGYGAAIQLDVTYSQFFNLFRLVEIFKKLQEFGYDVIDHTLPSIGVNGSIYVVEHSTAEASRLYLTDEEVSRHEKLLAQLLATRYLTSMAPRAKEECGVEIRISADGFEMVEITTGDKITIPNFDGFTPRHGVYPFDRATIDSALKVIGLLSDDDD